MIVDFEREIKTLLNEKAVALVEQNTVFFENLLDPSFVYINSRGMKSNKNQYVNQFASGLMKFKSQKFKNVDIADFGGFAVATMTVHDEFEYSGVVYSGVFHSLCVFKKAGTQWTWAAGQTFEVPSNEI